MKSVIRASVSVVLVMGPCIYFGMRGKSAEMGMAIVAGGLAAAFVNIDRIQRFRGGGFEAEMRRAVEEAYATTENLRALARPLILSTLQILTKAGRWGGMDPVEKHELREQLERIQGELRLGSDEALRHAHGEFFRYHTWDHTRALTRALEKNQQLSGIRREIEGLFGNREDFPSEEQIRSVLGGEIDKLTPTDEEILRDYLFYREHHRLRRPEALRSE